MAPGQDWCLQCGAGAPGSIGSPGWRSAATILGVAAVLALGAAAAAYAALSKESSKPATLTTTVAQATIPTTATTTPVTPGTTTVPTTPSVKSVLPQPLKPPKIPLTATPTPKSSTTTPANTTPTNTTSTGSQGTTTPTTPANTGTGSSGEENQSSILLDTNAASTYNPYSYPESDFGDPSLTIDGDTTTGWTAIVEPSTAPKMADGVLIDLKTPHKLGALVLITSTPGMTVQVYGSNAKTAPTSITDPAWVPISHLQTVARRHVRIKLRDQKKAFTFVTLWVSHAPAADVGTPEAPGHVSVNEIELFPATS
jgi:hypothetical protein